MMARRRTRAERLFTAAKTAAKFIESEKGLSKMEALHQAVTACFEEEDVDALYQALTLAEQAQDLGAAALMEATLEYVSTHQYENDGHSLRAISLIAVPVFIEILTPFRLDNSDLHRNAAFADLEQSFQKSGLVGNDTIVVLQNYLYHPHELDNLSYLDVAAITVNLQVSLLEGSAVSADQLGQTGGGYDVEGSDSSSRIELRYLLGVMRDNASDFPFMLNGRVGRSGRLFEKRLADWKELVLQLLPECLDFNGLMKLDVLKPHLFYEAYRQGLKALLNSDLYYSLVQDLARADILPAATHALIVPATKGVMPNCMVFVYTQEKDELLLARGRSILPFESAKETQMELTLVLNAVGIDEVKVLDEPPGRIAGCLQSVVYASEGLEEISTLMTLLGNDTVH